VSEHKAFYLNKLLRQRAPYSDINFSLTKSCDSSVPFSLGNPYPYSRYVVKTTWGHFKEIVDSQIMQFRPFLGIETFEKYHILKKWHVTVENWIYFHHILALYIVKKLWAKSCILILWIRSISTNVKGKPFWREIFFCCLDNMPHF